MRGSDVIANPTFIAHSLNAKNPAGIATKSGYHFKMYLPHKNKPVTDSDTTQLPSTDQESITAQEEWAIIYAWPLNYGITGRRCFVVGMAGIILQSNNTRSDGTAYYSGSTQIPPYNAAMPAVQAHLVTPLKWLPIQDNSTMLRNYEKNIFEVQKLEGIKGIDGQLWIDEWMLEKIKRKTNNGKSR